MLDLTQDPRLVAYRNGTIPTIITCGHGGQQPLSDVPVRIPGRNFVSKFYAGLELGALDLTLGIGKILPDPHVVVANFSRRYVDVNRPRKEAYASRAASPYWTSYHKRIRYRVRQLQQQGLLLDIHGTSNNWVDLYIGTCYLQTLWDRRPLEILLSHLLHARFRICIDHPHFVGGFTVRSYGASAGGLDAIQLEVSKPIRTSPPDREHLAMVLSAAIQEVCQSVYRIDAS